MGKRLINSGCGSETRMWPMFSNTQAVLEKVAHDHSVIMLALHRDCHVGNQIVMKLETSNEMHRIHSVVVTGVSVFGEKLCGEDKELEGILVYCQKYGVRHPDTLCVCVYDVMCSKN